MTSYVSVDLRRLVESRANRLCEYCLLHETTHFSDASWITSSPRSMAGRPEATISHTLARTAIGPRERTSARSQNRLVNSRGSSIRGRIDGPITSRWTAPPSSLEPRSARLRPGFSGSTNLVVLQNVRRSSKSEGTHQRKPGSSLLRATPAARNIRERAASQSRCLHRPIRPSRSLPRRSSRS